MKTLPALTGRSPMDEPYLDQMLRGWWSLTAMRFIPLYVHCHRMLAATAKRSAALKR